MHDQNQKEIGRLRIPYLLLFFTIIIVLISFVGLYYFQNAKLLGEELALVNQYPTITLTNFSSHNSDEVIEEDWQSPTSTQTSNTPTPTSIPLCNADQAIVYFLFIAKDYESHNNEFVNPEDYRVGFADAIRLIKVDFRNASISMLSIPRDLMVAVPALQKEGIYEARLKMVYAYGNEFDLPGGGASLVAQALQTNFGFQIDHYVILNFWSFVLGIESIGGIDVEIPNDAGYYSAGLKHMNGWQALDYARLRDQAGEDTSDASRRERQTQVLFAIQKKVFSTEVLPKIPSVVSQLLQAVKTDLTNLQIGQFMCLAEKITTVESQELRSDFYIHEVDAYNQERLIPDYTAIREFVQQFQDH